MINSFKSLIFTIIIARQGNMEKQILDEWSNLSFFEELKRRWLESCHDISLKVFYE